MSKTALYKATMKIMGKTITNTGKTAEEAISGLQIGNGRGVGVLLVTHGKNSKERILSPIQVSKIFNTRGTTQKINLKNITNLFEGI